MREYTTEPAERATERPFNLPDQLSPAGNQALPNLQTLGDVGRARSTLQTNTKNSNQSAARKKLIVGLDEKYVEDDESIVLAQATAPSPRFETAGAKDSAITVASEAAFNPECPAPTTDGCGLAVGAEGRSVVISPIVFAPLLALAGGGGGGGSPPPPLAPPPQLAPPVEKLQFTSGFGLGPGGKDIKIPLTNDVTGRSDFNTNKDDALGLTVVYEIVSPDDDVLEQLGASIDPGTGEFKFDSLDTICIGEEFQFLIRATSFKGDVLQETDTLAFNVKTIGPESTVQAQLSNFDDDSGNFANGTADLDVLTFDFASLSVDAVFSTVNLPYFGSEATDLLCIRFFETTGSGDEITRTTRYVELDSSIEYVYFGSDNQYNDGEPAVFPASVFGYEWNEIYKINHSASTDAVGFDNVVTVDGSTTDCNQLIYGLYEERAVLTLTQLTGGAGNDLIFGSESGENHLVGGAGDDFIIAISLQENLLHGGRGSDTLVGTGENNIFVYDLIDFTGSVDSINASSSDVFEVADQTFNWDSGESKWVSGDDSITLEDGRYFYHNSDYSISPVRFADLITIA